MRIIGKFSPSCEEQRSRMGLGLHLTAAIGELTSCSDSTFLRGKTAACGFKQKSDTFSETGKQWFAGLESDAHRVIGSRPIFRRGRVAVIDSGIDWDHPSFQESIGENQILTKSFVNGLDRNKDVDGHGTHTAHLVLKVAPNAKLFIARVYEHGTEEEIGRNVEAIVQVCT